VNVELLADLEALLEQTKRRPQRQGDQPVFNFVFAYMSINKGPAFAETPLSKC
jgi:hypothetical protein